MQCNRQAWYSKLCKPVFDCREHHRVNPSRYKTRPATQGHASGIESLSLGSSGMMGIWPTDQPIQQSYTTSCRQLVGKSRTSTTTRPNNQGPKFLPTFLTGNVDPHYRSHTFTSIQQQSNNKSEIRKYLGAWHSASSLSYKKFLVQMFNVHQESYEK